MSHEELHYTISSDTHQRLMSALASSGVMVLFTKPTKGPVYGSYCDIKLSVTPEGEDAVVLELGDGIPSAILISNRIRRYIKGGKLKDATDADKALAATAEKFAFVCTIIDEALHVSDKITLDHAETFDYAYTIFHTGMRKGLDSTSSSMVWNALYQHDEFDKSGFKYFWEQWKAEFEPLRGKTMSMYTFAGKIRETFLTASDKLWHWQNEREYDRNRESDFRRPFSEVAHLRKMLYLIFKMMPYDDWMGLAQYYEYSIPKEIQG